MQPRLLLHACTCLPGCSVDCFTALGAACACALAVEHRAPLAPRKGLPAGTLAAAPCNCGVAGVGAAIHNKIWVGAGGTVPRPAGALLAAWVGLLAGALAAEGLAVHNKQDAVGAAIGAVPRHADPRDTGVVARLASWERLGAGLAAAPPCVGIWGVQGVGAGGTSAAAAALLAAWVGLLAGALAAEGLAVHNKQDAVGAAIGAVPRHADPRDAGVVARLAPRERLCAGLAAAPSCVGIWGVQGVGAGGTRAAAATLRAAWVGLLAGSAHLGGRIHNVTSTLAGHAGPGGIARLACWVRHGAGGCSCKGQQQAWGWPGRLPGADFTAAWKASHHWRRMVRLAARRRSTPLLSSTVASSLQVAGPDS